MTDTKTESAITPPTRTQWDIDPNDVVRRAVQAGTLEVGVPTITLKVEVRLDASALDGEPERDVVTEQLMLGIARDLGELYVHGDTQGEDAFLRVRDGAERGNAAPIKIHSIKATHDYDIGNAEHVYVADVIVS